MGIEILSLQTLQPDGGHRWRSYGTHTFGAEPRVGDRIEVIPGLRLTVQTLRFQDGHITAVEVA